ncbi:MULTISPECIES: S46 family peptidase [unclassified Capnocytophaga]|uniref:S46 family peptidase n=1 Tax=unclassified Capnocytophaga TaxID=2640652 RepID=UPI000202B307|nr:MULTISPECIES: S46 family peptidase [unclassified Capnocytophaga]EGD34607.1 dipeptidyl-peptidase 7 [Capnocytophaga sp. oral taxon 338 str. F0234]MEB3005036.1 S46 family peptidase [Capnocytophaga sp. G2]
MRRFFKIALLLSASVIYAQQGGMWIPSLLEGMNAKEMKTLGMKMTVADIYSVNKSSLKDAAPHFNGGCSSEIISDKGLLLTNHHCGYGQIQSHSSLQNDYLTNGFWAKSFAEELPNKNLKVTFIVRIDDVTKQVLAGTANISDETQKAKLIEKNIADVIKTAPKEAWQDNSVKAFYDGNQYILFVTETFKDVRLVGAPPSSIGKFGSDTDNWVWPRHTGDFSLFRVYADKNNRPAEYSKDNVPYKPKHFFPISLKGVKEGDFVLVFGYPGTTQEYLPSVAVEQIQNVINPARIGIRDAALKVQDGFMRKDQGIKIKYASKYARIANYWKKWIGETKGLKKSDAVALKKQQEIKFQQAIQKANKQAQYGNLLTDFNRLYKEIEPYNLAYNLYNELMFRNVDFLANGVRLLQLQQVLDTKGEQAFNDRKKNLLGTFQTVFKDNVKQVDKEVFEKVIVFYAEHTPKNLLISSLHNFDAKQLSDKLYGGSFLTSYEGVEKVLALSPTEFKNQLKNDVGVQFARELMDMNENQVYPNYNRLNTQIRALQRTYMKAILEFSKPSDRIFPDANSTLRVTYGKVAGFSPADAITYSAGTTLEGVMEKYVPGDYEFDVPAHLRDLYAKKDFGRYGKNGKMPLCFLSTCHTTGGNSGSPAIDANGNLIGLNFDRVWEGTMSDIHYDPKLCRNIMVDIRYVLFIIDKYAGASHLINEMKLIK